MGCFEQQDCACSVDLLSSSACTLRANCRNYTLDSKERAQYRGMADKLESAVFLKNIAVMLDALEELADLSESLQADSMSMP
jgi:hypothetical protein